MSIPFLRVINKFPLGLQPGASRARIVAGKMHVDEPEFRKRMLLRLSEAWQKGSNKKWKRRNWK